MLRSVVGLVVAVVVFALVQAGGLSVEQVLNGVGLHEASDAISTAKNGFTQITEFFSTVNHR
jgi:hypothetical protein